jgi:hypothetical protein
MSADETGSVVARIAAFLEEIGIRLVAEPLPEGAFLPGVTIRAGALVYDPDRLLYPGDLVHEAGHIAVTEAERRAGLNGSVEDDPGEEMAAIAWSFAAARSIGLDPRLVLHDHGYRGGGAAYAAEFEAGRWFGVPLLAWYGLTTEALFPRMLRWLR